MAKDQDGTIDFNPEFFDGIMKSAGIAKLSKEVAEKAAAVARSTAPYKTGDYQRGIKVEKRESRYRAGYRVVGTDWKTMIIESKTGNLARALKAAKKT